METLAVAVFVFQRTHSPFLVAMMSMLRLLPMGLFGSFIGAWAERLQRRTGLLAVILLLASTDVVLALLAASGRLTVWQIAVGSFVNGIGWAADNPIRRVAMGEVAGAGRMGTAMSLDVMANNAMRILGPIIGGALLAITSIHAVFVLGAVLYITSLAATATLRYRNEAVHSSRGPVLQGVLEGVRVALNDRQLAATLLVTIIYNVFAWPFTSMVPVIAQQNLRLGAAATGALASVDGVGAVIGAVAMAIAAPSRNHGALYVGGMAVYSAMVAAFALSPTPLPAVAALLIEGVGSAFFSILQATLVYQCSPPEMRSRLLGLVSTCIGLGPIGFLHLGWMANTIGARPATALIGIEGLVALGLTFPLWRVLILRDQSGKPT